MSFRNDTLFERYNVIGDCRCYLTVLSSFLKICNAMARSSSEVRCGEVKVEHRTDRSGEFMWTPKCEAFRGSVGGYVTSPDFKLQTNTFYFRLYPIGTEEWDKEWVSLDLCRRGPPKSAEFSMFVKFKGTFKTIISLKRLPDNQESFHVSKLLERSHLWKDPSSLSLEGNMTIICILQLLEQDEAQRFVDKFRWSGMMKTYSDAVVQSSVEGRCGDMLKTYHTDREVHFEWTPEFEAFWGSVGRYITSPNTQLQDNTFYLHLYAQYTAEGQWEWVGLNLCRRGPPRMVTFWIYVILDGRCKNIVNLGRYFDNQQSFNVSKLLKRSDLWKNPSSLSHKDKLTIACKVRLDQLDEEMRGSGEEKYISRETQTEEPWKVSSEENDGNFNGKVDSTLLKHFKDLLLTGDDHDVTIKVKGQEFRAHKCVLRARSPVLAAMFKHEMKESADGSISIDDCDSEAFGEFLNYVYTGEVENLSPRKAMRLYYAGDKYDFSGLIEVCAQYLESSLATTSICDVIVLARKHGDKGLLEKAINFFSENVKEILPTVEWQRFAVANFTVANELLIKAINASDEKKT